MAHKYFYFACSWERLLLKHTISVCFTEDEQEFEEMFMQTASSFWYVYPSLESMEIAAYITAMFHIGGVT